ncbi:probable fructokinase-1 isoform X3 [Brassica napus]|uniref:probable fructokinase-1 isoform X3 n=1 Tax=Brassica napus TaxID=3708 RepID=UPI00207A69E8|nr:probable fructokinase-1 isoform X3 [Brassica napus]
MKKPKKEEQPLNLGLLELVRIPNVSVWYWTAPTDFVSFGEMLIDFVPTESGVSLAEAPVFLKAPGGAPAIVAIAVSRFGGQSAFGGKLGDNEFGHMLAGILRKNGVADQEFNFDTGARTALAFVTLKADGDREFVFYWNHSADMLLRPDELNLELIRSIRREKLQEKARMEERMKLRCSDSVE